MTMTWLSQCKPDFIYLEAGRAVEPMVYSDGAASWVLRSTEVKLTPVSGNQMVTIASPNEEIKRVILRWERSWSGPVQVLGDHWERGYGDLEWRGLVPERKLPWYFLVHIEEVTHGIGVKTRPGAICYWQADPRGFTLTLDVRNGTLGVQLGNRILSAATIVFREGKQGETPFEAASAFCRSLCDDPLLPDEPVYGSNNWYYAYGNSSHAEILNDCRIVVELSPKGGPRPYMVIDDGWQPIRLNGNSCNGGPWDRGNQLFPDMRRLAAEMKEIGVKPGIWYRPLLTSERVNSGLKRRKSDGDGSTVLDPSAPEALEMIAEDVQRLADWGYQLIKHDFSTFDIFGKWGFEMNESLFAYREPFRDRSKTTAEIIVNFYRVIREAAGDAIIIGCNTIGHLAAGLVHIQRTGDDTSGHEWERTRKMGVNTLGFRMPQHRAFFLADADCVGATDKLPWGLNRQWLELLAKSGTPLFVSADPSILTEEMKSDIKAAFEWASAYIPSGEPLDWIETTCPEKWKLAGEILTFNWNELCELRNSVEAAK